MAKLPDQQDSLVVSWVKLWAGTVDLRIGDVEILNFADGTFDKAFPTPKLSVMHYRTSWKIIPNERNTYPEC